MIRSVGPSMVVIVDEATKVGEARRRSVELADRLGFDETRQGKVALVVTEAATNLVKHAGGGELIVQGFDHGQRGSQVWKFWLSIRAGNERRRPMHGDGYSTAGSPGTGLGAISRLADAFEIYSASGNRDGPLGSPRSEAGPPGRSTIRLLELGVVRVAAPGEQVCGDDWATIERDGQSLILMVDGLGHGPPAAEAAAKRRCASSRAIGRRNPAEILEATHAALREHAGRRPGDRPARPGRRRGSVRRRGQYFRRDPRHDRPAKPRAWSRTTAPSGTRFARSRSFDYPWTEDSLVAHAFRRPGHALEPRSLPRDRGRGTRA